ncbi:MAG: preprotein translocase subunit YajC [Polyangia bacterium]
MSATPAAAIAWAQPAGAGAEPQSASEAPSGEGSSGTEAPQGPPPGGPCGGFGGYQGILMMLAMFAIFYFLLIRPQQKKAKEHQKMLDALGKGDEVVTNGGLVGRITAVTGKTLTLEISEKVRVRVVRSQIAGPYSAETMGEKK